MTYYDEIAEGYDELHKEEQLKKLEIIKKHISVDSDESLLDVGCGSGISTLYFKCNATGVDPSEHLIELAKSKGGAKFIVGSAENLSFSDNSFDFVISITAIQNFNDLEKGLSEIKRVGKKLFVISVLKKSSKLDKIQNLIEQNFRIKTALEEEKDKIFILEPL